MIWDPLSTWHLLGLLAFSLLATLATNWLAARLHRAPLHRTGVLGLALAGVVWVVLLFVAGVIAARYIERIDNALLGYGLFAAAAILLSLGQALLYRRTLEKRAPGQPLDRAQLFHCAVHNLTYLLFATCLFLVLAWLTGRPADPWSLISLYLGALLPDLDSRQSVLGRLLPSVSRRMERWLGHLEGWHTPVAAAFVALVTAPLLFITTVEVWYLISLGFLAHLLVDTFHPQGVMLLWPLRKTRYCILGGPVKAPGDYVERWMAAGLALATAVLLLVVDVGPTPPQPVATPTYEQTLERYYSLRGRYLVFASIEGSWQATGRRSSGRFEVINAIDRSFVMLDRYTGRVFTVGRTAVDNFYPSHISLQTGAAARIKPVEVHLEDQRLAEALLVVYQMQREPGLQYIFVSGEVVGSGLPTDYAQTSLPKIQAHDAGCHSLHYLTAGELIALANVQVETADLVIWATYVEPAAEPTVTPLPSPPPTPGQAP